jgi:uncharacterized RDD family membrane protein YckC
VYDVSFGRRFVALLIDWGVAMLSVVAFTGTPLAGAGAVSSFVTLGVFFLEVTLLTGTLGFSIGKRVTALKVVDPDGRPIGVPRAALRTLLLCLFVPAIIQNEDQRGLHEIVSGSRVARRVPSTGGA